MVKLKFKHTFLLLLFLASQLLFSQGHLRSEISVNRGSVFVGQPVEVSISVYTSTWFTAGVDPGNIKVKGAFTVYFRSLSNSKKINGKTYAGVTMYFNVFPYDAQNIEFPSLDIQVETPNTGGYKGVKRTVKTQARTIKVKPVPPNMNKDKWLVTTWMSVSENWSGNIKNVKVGDVLERKIFRNVSATVSELIPPIIWDTIPNVSLYPTRSLVKNNKTKTAISATRTEGMRYLFEQEGMVVIPKMELTWWDPYRNKLFKKTLPKVVIDVQANPDLGMLKSVKNQLEKDTLNEESEEDTALNIFGLSFKQFLLYVFIAILSIYLVLKIIRLSLKIYRKKRAAYLNSEKYYFDQFLKTTSTKSSKKILPKLYRWIDALNLDEPRLEYLNSLFGNSEFTIEIQRIEQTNSKTLIIKKAIWIQIRKNYLSKKPNNETSTKQSWINP